MHKEAAGFAGFASSVNAPSPREDVHPVLSSMSGLQVQATGLEHGNRLVTISAGYVGAGYVGGPTMAVIALKCPDIEVVVVDISKPCTDVVKQCRGKNLFFSTDVEKHVAEA